MLKKTNAILTSICLIFLFFVFSNTTLADTNLSQNAFDNANNKLNTIGEITGFGKTKQDVGIYSKIATIVNILLGFAGIIATTLIIFAGIKWITAQGNEDQVSSAKNTIRDAIIGIVVIFIAYIIVNFVITKLIEIFGQTNT